MSEEKAVDPKEELRKAKSKWRNDMRNEYGEEWTKRNHSSREMNKK